MKFIKKVLLDDEHKQPINIYANEDGYWWEFTDDPAEKYGPYRSKSEAIMDAEAFCGEAAAK